jgi:uncharacterized protein (TIGR03437 family)
MRITTALSYLLLAARLFAQGGATLAGAGYGIGTSIVAPGQIVNLQVAGLAPITSSPQSATTVPLPTELAGISVVIQQAIQYSTMGTTSSYSYNAPIVWVTQNNSCPSGPSDCTVTYLTVQMPYELQATLGVPPIINTTAVITQNGASSQALNLTVQTDKIHVVTNCEGEPNLSGCPQIVAHLDGTLVSAASPGQPGENVVVYAWGLGQTQPAAVTGAASGTPAPVVSVISIPAISIRLDFLPNAGPVSYFVNAQLVNGYLTPGTVGLYQINVQLPSVFPSVLPCGVNVSSNLTISLGEAASFDGAKICVAAK